MRTYFDNHVFTDELETKLLRLIDDEIKSAFDGLDEDVKKEFAAYVASLISQQKEAA